MGSDNVWRGNRRLLLHSRQQNQPNSHVWGRDRFQRDNAGNVCRPRYRGQLCTCRFADGFAILQPVPGTYTCVHAYTYGDVNVHVHVRTRAENVIMIMSICILTFNLQLCKFVRVAYNYIIVILIVHVHVREFE